jgi:3-phytase
MPLVSRVCAIAIVALAASCAERGRTTSPTLEPVSATVAVANDADDPAIWIDAAQPERSLIVATNKAAAPDGGLYVFGLDGAVRQIVTPLDRPNNVDVEYGLTTAAGPIDIAVATERLRSRLRVYRIDERGLAPIDDGGIGVLDGETSERAMPMGISLYRRPRDGAIFAIVAPKAGGTTNYLAEYRLTFDEAAGAVRGALVRRFGNFSGTGEIEAVAVDDTLGYVYYADEEYGIRKWYADPDHPDANRELAVFGRDGFTRQREGIAIVGNADGTGFIVCADQIPGGSALHLYRREGQPDHPHMHDPAVAIVSTRSDSTDGIDATSTSLGPTFSGGLLVMMNSRGQNFQFYDWAALLKVALQRPDRLPSVRPSVSACFLPYSERRSNCRSASSGAESTTG